MIYGLSLDRNELRKAYVDPDKNDAIYAEVDDDDDDDDDFDVSLSISGLEIHSTEDDVVFIGGCWSSVGDDETGRQFKERVREAIRAYLPTLADQCDTLSG